MKFNFISRSKPNFVQLNQSNKPFKICFGNPFAQGTVHRYLAKNFKGSYFEYFVGNVVRGNSVQILSNFPAKSLSIYLKRIKICIGGCLTCGKIKITI